MLCTVYRMVIGLLTVGRGSIECTKSSPSVRRLLMSKSKFEWIFFVKPVVGASGLFLTASTP